MTPSESPKGIFRNEKLLFSIADLKLPLSRKCTFPKEILTFCVLDIFQEMSLQKMIKNRQRQYKAHKGPKGTAGG